MPVIMRHMAKVILPDELKLQVLKMYSYTGYGDTETVTYKYSNGVALLPLHRQKLEEVARLLGEEIIDERSKGAPLESPFVLQPGFQFRPYQEVPSAQLAAYMDQYQYGTFSAGCGTGKTVICSYEGGRSQMKNLVLLDQSNLIDNWVNAYQFIWGKTPQILTAKAKKFADVCICTFQLLHANPELLSRIQNEFGHCNIDEAHTVKAATFKEVMFRLSNFRRLATSATFYNKYLPTDVLVDICGAPVAVSMVDDKALKCFVRFINTQIKVANNDPSTFTSKEQPLLAQNDVRNNLMIEIIRRCAALGRRMIVIAITKEQAAYIQAKCQEFCRAEVYVGSTSRKRDKELKDDFQSGRVQAVITCQKFNKGTDYDTADTLIMGRPYNNEAMVEQLRGRVVRFLPGKPEPWVFDLVDSGPLTWRWAGSRHGWYKGLGDRFDKPDYFFLDTP